jgi:Tn3 transposase DDE domain
MLWELDEPNLRAESHIRNGGDGAIGDEHVSDTSVALFSHGSPGGMWAAVYRLAGVLKKTSKNQPDRPYADTPGHHTPVCGVPIGGGPT